jgi:hypothetical protein
MLLAGTDRFPHKNGLSDGTGVDCLLDHTRSRFNAVRHLKSQRATTVFYLPTLMDTDTVLLGWLI